MSTLVSDCPRCNASKTTFDVLGQNYVFQRHQWQNWYEVFSICRHCSRSTTFVIGLKEYDAKEIFYKNSEAIVVFKDSLNDYFKVERYVCIADIATVDPPEHLPDNIKTAFNEGASCMAISCFNAAGTMFRLCLDFATKEMLPDPANASVPQPTNQQRHQLGRRIGWLLDNGKLPAVLEALAECVREDGNDGAHAGTLSQADAQDLLEFTIALLERLYTEPKKIQLAEERRALRRRPNS